MSTYLLSKPTGPPKILKMRCAKCGLGMSPEQVTGYQHKVADQRATTGFRYCGPVEAEADKVEAG